MTSARGGQLYQIDTGYYCAGLVVVDGRVTEAAPILHWAVGLDWNYVRRRVLKPGVRLTRVGGGEELR